MSLWAKGYTASLLCTPSVNVRATGILFVFAVAVIALLSPKSLFIELYQILIEIASIYYNLLKKD